MIVEFFIVFKVSVEVIGVVVKNVKVFGFGLLSGW